MPSRGSENKRTSKTPSQSTSNELMVDRNTRLTSRGPGVSRSLGLAFRLLLCPLPVIVGKYSTSRYDALCNLVCSEKIYSLAYESSVVLVWFCGSWQLYFKITSNTSEWQLLSVTSAKTHQRSNVLSKQPPNLSYYTIKYISGSLLFKIQMYTT